MPAPGSRIGAVAKSLDSCAGQNAFKPSAQTCHCFTFAFPMRFEHSQNVVCFNLVDRHLTDDGISVIHKRLSPLVTMNLTPQTLEPVGHVAFRTFLEGG